MLAAPDAHVSELAPFARHNLWVTAYDPALRYPAGDYPAWGDHGLGDPRREDHDIVQTDIVLWHCFAATHVPRIEDWPCMPVEHVGFTLHPSGFFDANPALDLPEPQHGDACH
jgi:primary-amine oxidase